MCGLKLKTKEIQSFLENLINRKQQQFLRSGAVVDSWSWDDQIACRHAARGKKNRVCSGIVPDEMVLLNDNEVGTSQRRVNKGGTALELQGGRKYAR